MSDDVTIPRETARDAANLLRIIHDRVADDLADLLDPPQTLREKVQQSLHVALASFDGQDVAATVLAVIADDIEAIPTPGVKGGTGSVTHGIQRAMRDLIVARLRGES